MRKRPRRATVEAATIATVLLFCAKSHADESRGGDRTYGRLDGDLSVVLGAGATVAARAPRGTADVRLRYLDIIGLFGSYEDGFGGASEPTRVIATGLELRPLFLGRWLKGMQSGSALVDLTLDSLGFEVGAAFSQPKGSHFQSRPALQLGLGLEVPLFARAEGLWLGAHGGARFGERAFDASGVSSPLDRAGFVSFTLAYHAYFASHLVDAGDRLFGGN